MASTPGRRGSITSNNSKSPHRQWIQWIPIVSPPPTTTTNNHGNHNNGGNNSNNNNIKYGNKHVDAELEALKQRGLAKMLNKHFTETALQLEQEKAAADAALRDLEERKSRTSEYTGPNYNHTGISPLDEMCLQANRWRAECRRKEKETMLLYQRYVHRFGDTLHSIVPHCTPDSPTTSAPPPRKAPTTTTTSTTPSSLVPNMAKQIEATLEEYLKQGAVSVPSMQTIGKDETYQNLQKKEEEQFRNFYRRQLEQKGIDVKYPGFSITNRPDFPGFPINTIEEKRNVSSDENDNDDDESVMSELTTLQSVIIQDCERSVVTYLQEEHKKIQSLLRGDDDDQEDMDENESAVSQAESMVQQMEEILAEYQNARPSIKNSKHAKSQHPPRQYPTDNPNEHWTVYYDEFYQQDYYHEKFTNRTQWEPPMSGNNSRSRNAFNNDSTSCSSATTHLTVSEVMPDIRVYRQRRRAKRRSQRTYLLLLSTVIVAAVAIIYQYDRQNTVLRAVLPEHWAKYILPPAAEPAKSRAMDYYSQKDEVEEPTLVMAYEPVVPAPLLVPSQQQLAPMVFTTTADDDKNDGHDNNALATNVNRPWFCSFPLSSWLDRRCQESPVDASAVATTTDVDDKNDEYALMHRPWLCNLPLACWLHRRCWILAKRKPLFNTQELIDRMFQ
jgi:hypothetical protein